MAKDPAFLFYASDFLSGVSDLTMEERGQYITLLCLQQQKGHLNRKTLGLCLGFDWDNASEDLKKKFIEDDDGLFYNVRLDEELSNRAYFTEKQRNNGKKGGRPKTQTKTQTASQTKAKQKPNKSLLEDRDRNENIIKNKEKEKKEGKGGKGEREEIYDWSIVDPDYVPAMQEWIAYKAERNEGYKPRGFKAEYSVLRRLSNGDPKLATLIVEQSIARDWQGLFELSKSSAITEPKQGNRWGLCN